MALRAARLLLGRWRELVVAGTSFAVESTLSGRTYAAMLRDARHTGYAVYLAYLWLPSATFSRRRVRQRVRKGGHDVPAADILRRYLPSLQNLFNLYLPLADEATLYQAAVRPPQLVARWDGANVSILKPEIYGIIRASLTDSSQVRVR